MPRGPRLDVPGLIHHVMARGLDPQVILRDDRDGDDFVLRLAALAETGAVAVYVWVLLPTHYHLLVRTGTRPLSRSMRSLVTGYAGSLNRRRTQASHLFQNRYKSIVVEEEPYLLELVRYLHLNPLRVGITSDLNDLAKYPYCGHGAISGTRAVPLAATATVLRQFRKTTRPARTQNRAFVAGGIPEGRCPDLPTPVRNVATHAHLYPEALTGGGCSPNPCPGRLSLPLNGSAGSEFAGPDPSPHAPARLGVPGRRRGRNHPMEWDPLHWQ